MTDKAYQEQVDEWRKKGEALRESLLAEEQHLLRELERVQRELESLTHTLAPSRLSIRVQAIQVVLQAEAPVSTDYVAKRVRGKRQTVLCMLARAHKAGKIRRVQQGLYAPPQPTPEGGARKED